MMMVFSGSRTGTGLSSLSSSSSSQDGFDPAVFRRGEFWETIGAEKEKEWNLDSSTLLDKELSDVETMRMERDEARVKLIEAQEEIRMLRSKLAEKGLRNALIDTEEVFSNLSFEIVAAAGKHQDQDKEVNLAMQEKAAEGTPFPSRKERELEAELKNERETNKKLEALVAELGAQNELNKAVLSYFKNILKNSVDAAVKNMQAASMKLAIVEESSSMIDGESKWESTLDISTECNSISGKLTKETTPSDVFMKAINLISTEELAEFEEMDSILLEGN